MLHQDKRHPLHHLTFVPEEMTQEYQEGLARGLAERDHLIAWFQREFGHDRVRMERLIHKYRADAVIRGIIR